MKQKRTKILLLLLMASISSLIGQQNGFKGKLSNSFNYEDVYILKKVTFWEPSGFFGYQSWIQIMSDDDPNDPISGSSNTIAWENGKKVKPIVYVSNSNARLETEFEISCSGGNASKYYARATNEDGYNFPVRELTLSNGRNRYPKTDCDKKFDDKVVRYWENFELKWEISNKANGPWIDCGSCKNYLYVTHKLPLIGLTPAGHSEPTYAQLTFIHIGCKNANGKSSSTDIVDNIYTEFTDQDVRRFDQKGPIQYWGTNVGSPECWQPSKMLINLDGRCGGWAAFFDVIIRLQGIAVCEISAVDYNSGVLPPNSIMKQESDIKFYFGAEAVNVQTLDGNLKIGGKPERSHFYVKNWNLSISVPDLFFVHHFYNDLAGFSTLPITLLNGALIDDKELGGILAQGNSNPRSEFENHAIVKFNGKYYDPSYGSPISSNGNLWEDQSIDAIGGMVYFEQTNTINGVVDRFLINWLDQLNVGSQQLTITP